MNWRMVTRSTIFLIALSLSFPGMATTILVDPADTTIHDILTVSGGFDDRTLFLSATFRAGTFDPDPNRFAFAFMLDTDLNPGTGETSLYGAEFVVEFHHGGFPAGAAIVVSAGRTGGGIVLGTVPVSFSTDALALGVPLSLLANDDGMLNFGLWVGAPQFPGGPVAFSATDVVAAGGPTTRVQTVPEPGSLPFLSGGVAGLVVLRRLITSQCG